MTRDDLTVLTPELRERGWVLREPSNSSECVCLVRGTVPTDHYVDRKRGFVYAYTSVEALEYDQSAGLVLL